MEQRAEIKVKTINVGSRNSQLALIQTNLVLNELEKFYENNPNHLDNDDFKDCALKFNIISMTTEGDRILDKPLPDIGAKSLFTKDLEVALLDGRVDFIVHSLKDLPTILPNGCSIGAVIKRDDPNDTIVLKKSLAVQMKPLDLLLDRQKVANSDKLKIGTSSQRRIAMVRRYNPELACVNIRGNLNTRLSKLDDQDSEYSAIILARAGLNRMGWSDRSSCSLSPEDHPELADWCYAVGQGAIAVECRSGDKKILDLLTPIIDLKTTYEVVAERSLMRKLEGGCSVPLGVRSTWTDKRPIVLKLESILLSIDGKTIHKACDSVALSNDTDVADNSAEYQPGSTTTGIILPGAILCNPNVRQNLIECSKLGINVANKMVDSGALKLIKRLR